MSSTHSDTLIDEDVRCVINIDTRQITSSSAKNVLVQYDHNSERIGFEIERYIDGHDMSKSDRVSVLYTNGEYTGLYIVDDVEVSSEDENKVVFTWLISGTATQNVSTILFAVNFRCFNADETISYNWSTRGCTLFNVVSGGYLDASETLPPDYNDVLCSFEKKIDDAIAEFSDKADIAEGVAKSAIDAAASANKSKEDAEQLVNDFSTTVSNATEEINSLVSESKDSIQNEAERLVNDFATTVNTATEEINGVVSEIEGDREQIQNNTDDIGEINNTLGGNIEPENTNFITCNRQMLYKDKFLAKKYWDYNNQKLSDASADGFFAYPTPIDIKSGTYYFNFFNTMFSYFVSTDGIKSQPLTKESGNVTFETDGKLYITAKYPCTVDTVKNCMFANAPLPTDYKYGAYNIVIPELITPEKPKPYVVVDIKGNGDFTNIQDALDNINDNSSNHITIVIMPGVYPRFTTDKNDVRVTRYVSFLGIDRDYCIIKDTTAKYQTPPAEIITYGTIKNLSFIATNENYDESEPQGASYAIHIDGGGITKQRYENCYLYSTNGPAVGIGFTGDGAVLDFDNCEFITEITGTNGTSGLGAFYCHTRAWNGIKNQKVLLNNCKCINKTGTFGAVFQQLKDTNGEFWDTTQTALLTNNCFVGKDGANIQISGTWDFDYSYGNNIELS